jgi:hypothetical protein
MTDLACPHGRKWTKCETCELIEAEIRITAMQEEISRLNEYIAEMVRMAAVKHRPAYDEQQTVIMGLQEEIATLQSDLAAAREEIARAREAVTIGASLLRKPSDVLPEGCYCKPGKCGAPKPEWCRDPAKRAAHKGEIAHKEVPRKYDDTPRDNFPAPAWYTDDDVPG